jgi:hypothetical protein
MTPSVRLMARITGLCLLGSAFALILAPAENIWPWVLLFVSVGAGLVAGSVAAQRDEDAAQRRARQADQG